MLDVALPEVWLQGLPAMVEEDVAQCLAALPTEIHPCDAMGARIVFEVVGDVRRQTYPHSRGLPITHQRHDAISSVGTPVQMYGYGSSIIALPGT